jgi:hypothetical protein
MELTRPSTGERRVGKGKNWAKVLAADSRRENKKAPFPGLFQ